MSAMSALLLLFVCLVLGALVRRLAQPPAGIVHGLNWWVLNIALPALVLELIPQVRLDAQLWFLVAAMWLTFFGAWLLFAWIGPRLGWSRGRVGALVLVCGLGNTSFMGYPLLQALHGQAGLTLAVVADQLGCFPLLASVGVVVACLYAGRDPDRRRRAGRLAGRAGRRVQAAGGHADAAGTVLGGTAVPPAGWRVSVQRSGLGTGLETAAGAGVVLGAGRGDRRGWAHACRRRVAGGDGADGLGHHPRRRVRVGSGTGEHRARRGHRAVVADGAAGQLVAGGVSEQALSA